MGALCSDFWDGLNIWVVLYLNGLIIKSSRTFQQRATKTITFRKCQSPTSLKITVVIKSPSRASWTYGTHHMMLFCQDKRKPTLSPQRMDPRGTKKVSGNMDELIILARGTFHLPRRWYRLQNFSSKASIWIVGTCFPTTTYAPWFRPDACFSIMNWSRHSDIQVIGKETNI